MGIPAAGTAPPFLSWPPSPAAAALAGLAAPASAINRPSKLSLPPCACPSLRAAHTSPPYLLLILPLLIYPGFNHLQRLVSYKPKPLPRHRPPPLPNNTHDKLDTCHTCCWSTSCCLRPPPPPPPKHPQTFSHMPYLLLVLPLLVYPGLNLLQLLLCLIQLLLLLAPGPECRFC